MHFWYRIQAGTCRFPASAAKPFKNNISDETCCSDNQIICPVINIRITGPDIVPRQIEYCLLNVRFHQQFDDITLFLHASDQRKEHVAFVIDRIQNLIIQP